MKRLVKTLYCGGGELYATKAGRRMLLAHCNPRIEVYEESKYVPMAGNGYHVKTWHISLVLCESLDLTCEVGPDYFTGVTGFDLKTDIQRTDGILEAFTFNNISPVELDLMGEWKFSIEDPAVIRNLLTL